MPFPMKIQPIDIDSEAVREPVRIDSAAKPVLKSRLRRLFDRQFPSVLRISSTEKPTVAGGDFNKDGGGGGGAIAEFEPSSVCLAKMVQNFLEETNEKQQATKCGRNRCNCFNGNNNDSSDDELDVFGGESITTGGSFGGDASDVLKSLIPCASVHERNLLADSAKIVETNKNIKQKDELRKIVTDGLSSLGYDSSICKSKWDKSPSFPAGEYEYIDVMVEGDRLLIDIDFRSEFEVARPTGAYKAVLQSLPFIFVGKSDRLGQIVSIVTEAAKQSLKKKGMPFPPWRKAEYVRAKWLSPCTTRTTASQLRNDVVAPAPENGTVVVSDDLSECGELELIFGEDAVNLTDPSPEVEAKVTGNSVAVAWQPPAVKPKSVERGARIVTGLASLLAAKP
ncbi:hypothetical protein RchiOBHm_Chr4g0388891 [Rosa chinensis]|uniref:DUF506 family protein n=1 Tax=Rosa chinensis TaxID=74649 RepID=A0A2P6QPV0_ROSCH|nr:uncharacterized protein LOC112199848 [Rosa chinensis]PRQ36206.1 hypothetical protein RchiOBHm_Chr4g0388891 [Rosa chinensis]